MVATALGDKKKEKNHMVLEEILMVLIDQVEILIDQANIQIIKVAMKKVVIMLLQLN